MRKIITFISALVLSLILFIAVALASFVLYHTKETGKENEIKSIQNGAIIPLLAIYENAEENELYATFLELDTASGKCRSNVIDCDNELKMRFYSNGLYPFVDECFKKAGADPAAFIALNSETFVILADRLNNIIYHEQNRGKRLLTGEQANELLTPQNFASFSSLMAEKAMQKGLADELVFVSRICENNLSYPRLLEKTKQY